MKKLIIGKMGALVATIAILGLAGGSAFGGLSITDWQKITSNTTYDPSGIFDLNVNQSGTDATFTFSKLAADSASLTGIAFDVDGIALTYSGMTPSLGVSYQVNNSFVLPGGNTVGFVTDFGFEPNSAGGVLHNGINNVGEYLTLTFALGSTSFSDLINAINDGDFRVGIHVQGIGTANQSDAFVNTVPEPTTVLAGILLLVPLGLSTMRQLRRRN